MTSVQKVNMYRPFQRNLQRPRGNPAIGGIRSLAVAFASVSGGISGPLDTGRGSTAEAAMCPTQQACPQHRVAPVKPSALPTAGSFHKGLIRALASKCRATIALPYSSYVEANVAFPSSASVCPRRRVIQRELHRQFHIETFPVFVDLIQLQPGWAVDIYRTFHRDSRCPT